MTTKEIKKAKIQKKDIVLNKMKAGEYQVHVLIQSTSGVHLHTGNTTQAVIQVKVFGKSEFTKKKTIGYQETYWGEHFFFNYNFDDPNKIKNQRITLLIWDTIVIGKIRKQIIGSYQLDLQRIYSEKSHNMKHFWVALSNIQRKFNEITGYIKISVSVIGQQDPNVQLEVQPLTTLTHEKNVLLPPNIQRKTYQLVVQLYEGMHIKPTDQSSSDTYVGVEFGQLYVKSNTIMGASNPKFYQKLLLPIGLPTVIDNIAIRIIDFNYIKENQVLGSYYVDINELLEEFEKGDKIKVNEESVRRNYSKLQWINFYGPQLKTNNKKQKNIQQFFPQLAPYYVGSLLMKISIFQKAYPIIDNKETIPRSDIVKINKMGPVIFLKLTATITAAFNLIHKSDQYLIHIRFGHQFIETQYKKAKNGCCIWNIIKTVVVKIQPQQEPPDIFIYLVNSSGQKISYKRYPASMNKILPDNVQWINLQPDPSISNMKYEEAGFLKVDLQIQSVPKKQPVTSKKFQSQFTKLIDDEKPPTGKLICQLISAQSLLPLDQQGDSDPFFQINYLNLKEPKTSQVKQNTLNPVYFEKIVIDAHILDIQSCPPIIVNVYDQDSFRKQFIGTAMIDVTQAIKNKSLSYITNYPIEDCQRPKPHWFQLKNNKMFAGKFLASFTLIPQHKDKIERGISISHSLYKINLLMLGLRGLKSPGLFSIKKPYITFDYESLNLYNTGPTTQNKYFNRNVITQPKQSGNNINIGVINKTVLYLPDDIDYWPKLTGKVQDYVLGGIYQPIVGYFSIDLKQAYKESKLLWDQIKKKKDPDNIFCNALKNFNFNRPFYDEKLKKVSPKLLKHLETFIVKCIGYRWNFNDKNLQLNSLTKYPDRPLDQHAIVLFPQYEQSQRGRYKQLYKHKFQQNQQYTAIGYDTNNVRSLPTLDQRSKHYRYTLQTPLQQYYKKFNETPMGLLKSIDIRRGRVFDNNDLLNNIIRNVSEQDSYAGYFKGNCFVQKYINEPKDYKSQNNIMTQETQQNASDQIYEYAQQQLKKFMKKTKIWAYLYILQACNLPSKDTFSHSDPYLVIKAGQQQFNFSDEAFQDDPNPQFNKKVKILLELPLDSVIQIQVWDKDLVKMDDLIGETFIDVQNRIISGLASPCLNNPVQCHNLYAKHSKKSQGNIKFWLDLVFPQEMHLYREFNIAPKTPQQLQIRIIVWQCSDLPIADFEGMCDLFVTCQFQDEVQQTDTHFRSPVGFGSFNWRMVFQAKMPLKNTILTFRIYDKDILVLNEYLASASFDLREYLNEVWQSDFGTKLYLGDEDLSAYSDAPSSNFRLIEGKKKYDRFEVQIFNKSDDRQNNRTEAKGKLELSIQIVTKDEAAKRPVGKGRGAPNQHPFLPEPKDRFIFSWNPVTLCTRLFGRRFRAQITILFFVIILILLIYFFGQSFIGSILGNVVSLPASFSSKN